MNINEVKNYFDQYFKENKDVVMKMELYTNSVKVYFKKDSFKKDNVYGFDYFVNNFEEEVANFKKEAEKHFFEANIRASNKSIPELIKECHENGYKLGYLYDLASALEFVRINKNSITILDALDNKKYLSFDTVSEFVRDALFVF